MKTTLFAAALALVSAKSADFSSDSYIAMSAQDKHDKLWASVTANEKSYGWYNAVEMLGIMTESMAPTFDT